MSSPECAVVIPIRCASKTRLENLDACLGSLTRQSTPVLGIIVDDDSPMRSEVELLVKDHGKRGHLRFVGREKPMGEAPTSSGALNLGIELVLDRGKEILGARELAELRGLCYLHSDDLLPIRSIEKRMAKIETCSMVYGHILCFDDETGQLILHATGRSFGRGKIAFPHHTALWTLELLREARLFARERYGQDGIFDTTLSCAEDWDATLTIASCARRLRLKETFVDELLYYYRIHIDSISGTINSTQRRETMYRIAVKHGVALPFLLWPLIKDPPWSLFFWLPEDKKPPLRNIRDAVKKGLSKRTRADDIAEEISADPYFTSRNRGAAHRAGPSHPPWDGKA